MTTTASHIPTRNLDTLEVPAIGYGAMVLVDGMYGRADDEARSVATLRHAPDTGASLIETSDAYGPDGHNERLVGRAVNCRRDDAILATKWGIVPDGRVVPGTRWANEIRVDLSPARAAAALDASLRRLGTDHIDLWYPHFPDPAVPIEETIGAMAEQVVAGKVRHLGLSNVTARQVLAAHAVHPIAAVQVEWSLWTRTAEAELLPVVRELGIGLVAWSPLGSGFLAGSADHIGTEGPDFRPTTPASAPSTSLPTATDSHPYGRCPKSSALHRLNSRSPGCCTRTSTSSPSPGPAHRPGSTRTSQPPT